MRRRRVKRTIKGRLKESLVGFYQHPAGRPAKKALLTLIGVIITLLGFVLIVLPGPAFLLIPVGLAILALEYPSARKWLRKFQHLLTVSAAKADAFFERRKAKS